jgi:branched-subunit amino acid transport protein
MNVTLVILAIALGTIIFRLVPLALLSRMSLPTWLQDWLGLVPAAVLSAMLAQSLFVQEGRLALAWQNTFLLAAVPTFVVAWRTRRCDLGLRQTPWTIQKLIAQDCTANLRLAIAVSENQPLVSRAPSGRRR